MNISLAHLQFKPGKIDEALGVWENEVAPEVSSQPGFVNGYIAMDRKTNRGIVLGFWDSLEDSIAFETSGHFRNVVGKLIPMLEGPPVRENYEVGAES